MELSIEQKQALDCLYGKKPLPICAVSHSAALLWHNLCYEQRYLLLLLGQRATDRSFQPGAETLLWENGNCIRCTAEHMDNGDNGFYLLQFVPVPLAAEETDAAPKALQACAAGNRLAAGEALYALGDIYRSIRSSNCGEAAFAAADRLLAACYHLLRQALHCEELAWYAEKPTSETAPVTDLAEQGMRLSLAMERIAGDLLPHSYMGSDVPLWVCADEERLFFALLAMYLLIRRDIDGDAIVHIRCEETGAYGVISMEAELLGAYHSPGVHAPTVSPTDQTELSDEALIRLFCKRFQGTLLHRKTENGSTLSLRLPLIAPDALPFESPERAADEGRYAPEWIMLSALIDYRHMGRF